MVSMKIIPASSCSSSTCVRGPKHLRTLRRAGLVRMRKVAQRRLYSLDPAPLADLDAWLAPYRAVWNDRLDALERHLREENPE